MTASGVVFVGHGTRVKLNSGLTAYRQIIDHLCTNAPSIRSIPGRAIRNPRRLKSPANFRLPASKFSRCNKTSHRASRERMGRACREARPNPTARCDCKGSCVSSRNRHAVVDPPLDCPAVCDENRIRTSRRGGKGCGAVSAVPGLRWVKREDC
jgi:hypothetical protein